MTPSPDTDAPELEPADIDPPFDPDEQDPQDSPVDPATLDRVALATIYAKTQDPIILAELHRQILRDIEANIQAFPKDAALDEQKLALGRILNDAARLTDDSSALILKKLASLGLMDRKTSKAKIASIRESQGIQAPPSNGTGPTPTSELILDNDPAREPNSPDLPPGPVGGREQPFQCLGYNSGIYFYLPIGARQVTELRPRDHNKNNFLHLARMNYWDRAYPGEAGPKWDLATNSLMAQCQAAGVYDPDRVRGRGAWWEDGEVVLHLGDRLIVGDKSIPVEQSGHRKYIYESAPPMAIGMDNPMGTDEAKRLAEIAELFSWDKKISSRFLAGWITVAPICGALRWRPHILITGAAGSGKSWAMDMFIRRMLGSVGLPVIGETTEAGVRQRLGQDARPIIFDEAEGNNDRSRARIQNILSLARQASSEDAAPIVKGTPSGIAKTYRIRSCFAFSSININVHEHADATRVTILGLEKRYSEERFKNLKAQLSEVVTEDYVRRFIARSIRMVPIIRQNAEIFATASARVIGSQRMGDQVGVLLGGAYSLYNDTPITPEAAAAWVARQDWSEQHNTGGGSDEGACLNRILEHVLPVRETGAVKDRSIYELLEIAVGYSDDTLNKETAEDTLRRVGIRTVPGRKEYIVADQHGYIEKILKDTPWARTWSRIIRRIPGAKPTENVVRFAGVQARGTVLELDGEWVDTEQQELPSQK